MKLLAVTVQGTSMLMNVVVAIAMDGGDQGVPGLKLFVVLAPLIYGQFKITVVLVKRLFSFVLTVEIYNHVLNFCCNINNQ